MTTTSAKDVVLEIICPMFGMIISNVMFMAPFKDLKAAIVKGELGDLNPTPWAVMLGNCCGWVTYGILQQNLWIYFANCPGFILSVWLNLGAAKLQYQHHHAEHIRSSFVSFLQQNTTTANSTDPSFRVIKRKEEDDNEEERVFLSTSSFRVVLAPTATKTPQEDAHERNSPTSSSMSTVEVDVTEDVEACPEQPINVDGSDSDDDDKEDTKLRTNNATTETDKEANATNVVAAATDAITTAAAAVTDWAKVVWNVTSETTPAPAPHERLVLFFVVVWVIVISIVTFAKDSIDDETKQLIVGTVVNMNLVFFYGSPLSTIFAVIREKNSASIHIPTMVTNTLNGTFWFIYGMAILDFFVAVPNGLGTLLGVVQIVLCATFPRHSHSGSDNNPTNR
mmetsp:Transcript_31050/g.75040  ORF Transcript_31050/g.75040 Transcript_31050/m.75040 type:complete len:395 (-) Transcript_31050:265-1449(-)